MELNDIHLSAIYPDLFDKSKEQPRVQQVSDEKAELGKWFKQYLEKLFKTPDPNEIDKKMSELIKKITDCIQAKWSINLTFTIAFFGNKFAVKIDLLKWAADAIAPQPKPGEGESPQPKPEVGKRIALELSKLKESVKNSLTNNGDVKRVTKAVDPKDNKKLTFWVLKAIYFLLSNFTPGAFDQTFQAGVEISKIQITAALQVCVDSKRM